KVSAAALGVRPQPGGQPQPGTCVALNPGTGPAVIAVPPEGMVLRADSAGTRLTLRRYASGSFPVALGSLPAGRSVLLRIPADGSSQPWNAQLGRGGRVTACRSQPE